MPRLTSLSTTLRARVAVAPSTFSYLSTSASCRAPNTLPSSANSSTPAQANDTYTKGFHPKHGENLVAPFASESMDQLYAKRPAIDPDQKPAFHSSSTSVDPPHPYTTSQVQHTNEEAVGSSAAVRHREPSWDDKSGKNYGVGLQDADAVVKNKDGSKLPDVNAWPDAEQGRQGIHEAWKGRK
ncbi:hypothetical protein DL93DRAFT_2075930 [Clavulina sp. PMI_390]|nr:hypothetical protein DL93DRAFT_2075930 [Clavulina sp. PMI_390]